MMFMIKEYSGKNDRGIDSKTTGNAAGSPGTHHLCLTVAGRGNQLRRQCCFDCPSFDLQEGGDGIRQDPPHLPDLPGDPIN